MMGLITLAQVAAAHTQPDTREALAKYWNQRITVQATFQRFGFTQQGRKVAVIEAVTVDGVEVASHIWIPVGTPLKRLHLKRGCRIQFEARVMRYVKNDPCVFHYGLDDIAAPCLLRRK